MALYTIIANKVAEADQECPILLEPIDETDCIRIIGNSVRASPQNIIEMRAQGIKCDKPMINHIKQFSVSGLSGWIKQNPINPLTRRKFTTGEINRIQFRFDHKDIMPVKMSESLLVKYYCDTFNNNFINSDDVVALLRCHLKPEMLPNFFNINREEAIKLLIENKDIGWILRPSSYNGDEYYYDDDKKIYYPICKNYAITVRDEELNIINHFLLEYTYSSLWFNTVMKNNKIFRNGHVCFFDVLKDIISDSNKYQKFIPSVDLLQSNAQIVTNEYQKQLLQSEPK